MEVALCEGRKEGEEWEKEEDATWLCFLFSFFVFLFDQQLGDAMTLSIFLIGSEKGEFCG